MAKKTWTAIDNCYGEWVASEAFKTKKEAVAHAVRDSDSEYKSSRVRAGLYEIEFSGDTDHAMVCDTCKLKSLGYVNEEE